LAARTRRELLALFDDLPQPLPDLSAVTVGAIASDGTKPSPTSAVEGVATAATALCRARTRHMACDLRLA
jgi:hypothetical protein